MRSIFVFNDRSSIDYTLVTNDQTVTIHGLKSDIDLIIDKHLDQPGVYILLSENMLYIGQSGTNVKSRLRNHVTEKTWWTEYIVITDEHGLLEKTMVEYMETYFIQKLRQKGLTLDNDTKGNSTVVSSFTEMKTHRHISSAEDSIFNVLNRDLMKPHQNSNILETPSNHRVTINDSNGNSFDGSSASKALQQMLVHYSKDLIMCNKLYDESTDEPSSTNVITSYRDWSNLNDYIELTEDLYMYTKLSRKQALEQIAYMSSVLNIEVEIK